MIAAVGYLGIYRASKIIAGASLPRALALFQVWSRRACALLRLSIRVHGQVPDGNYVYISNHRSYLDIAVLASVLGVTFLSNDDVATWPVVGAAASELGVVFVDRAETRARVRAARQIIRKLHDTSMVVFAEGTTHGGELPGPFHEGLFRLLARLERPAVPVTLRYSSRRAYWIDDISVGEHLRREVLANGPLRVDVHIGAPISPCDDFSKKVYDAVCAPLLASGEMV